MLPTFATMRFLSLLFGVLALSTSCNVARMQVRKTAHRLEKEGYAARSFQAPDGAHFVWSRSTGKEKILLLHGYNGTGQLQWSRTAQLLSEDHDVIMPDLLCHGRSTTFWRADTSTFPGISLEAQVAHVTGLLDSLGVSTPITVVGNSYGGGVAAWLAQLHPERVKKLVIYDGLVSDYTKAMADSIARSVGAPGMLAVMSTPTAADLRIGLKLALYRQPPIPGFILRQIYETNVRPFRPAQITLIKDLMANEQKFTATQFNWPMPVYLIWGERDRLIPNSVGLAVMARNGIALDHWTVIPKTGHVANLERPKAFDKALRVILAAP